MDISYCSRSARKIWRLVYAAVTKRRCVAPTKTIASLGTAAMHRARRRRPVHYPCNYEESYVPVPITVKHSVQQVSADRLDVNQKSKAINWRGRARTFSGRKRETRMCVSSWREETRRDQTIGDEGRGRVPPVFRVRRARRDPDLRASAFSFLLSRQRERERDAVENKSKARAIWNVANDANASSNDAIVGRHCKQRH